MKIGLLLATVLTASVLTSANTVRAEGQGGFVTLVTVNDIPITSFDVDQRVNLAAILGRGKGSPEDQRKRALQSLIDDQVKLAEAKKYNAIPDNKMVEAQIDKMAKGSNTDAKGLGEKLKAKGSSMSSLRTLVIAQIAFNRLITAMYKVKVEVEPAEIDKKYNEIANDPRLQPITVYEILEIEMPVENTGDAMAQQLLIARAADATQYRSDSRAAPAPGKPPAESTMSGSAGACRPMDASFPSSSKWRWTRSALADSSARPAPRAASS